MSISTFSPDDAEFRTAAGPTIFEAFEYSAAVKAGGFLYVAGQIGLREDGTIPASDAEQIEHAFRRLKRVIEGAGYAMGDIVELVSYHVGIAGNLADFTRIKSDYIAAPYSAWTILEVAGLARKDLVIEIKAVAYRAP
ncbi:Rid family hydrolase [Pararhodobacter oceanensis]|uniref:Rid family hydrolase n=1 Tax=Pararhodobacter oceanensis TaxID=2172121 RepID=UPI003A8F9D63